MKIEYLDNHRPKVFLHALPQSVSGSTKFRFHNHKISVSTSWMKKNLLLCSPTDSNPTAFLSYWQTRRWQWQTQKNIAYIHPSGLANALEKLIGPHRNLERHLPDRLKNKVENQNTPNYQRATKNA